MIRASWWINERWDRDKATGVILCKPLTGFGRSGHVFVHGANEPAPHEAVGKESLFSVWVTHHGKIFFVKKQKWFDISCGNVIIHVLLLCCSSRGGRLQAEWNGDLRIAVFYLSIKRTQNTVVVFSGFSIDFFVNFCIQTVVLSSMLDHYRWRS